MRRLIRAINRRLFGFGDFSRDWWAHQAQLDQRMPFDGQEWDWERFRRRRLTQRPGMVRKGDGPLRRVS